MTKYIRELPRLSLSYIESSGDFITKTINLEATGLNSSDVQDNMAYLLYSLERYLKRNNKKDKGNII